MFRRSELGRTRPFAIGGGNCLFLSSFGGRYPHVERQQDEAGIISEWQGLLMKSFGAHVFSALIYKCKTLVLPVFHKIIHNDRSVDETSDNSGYSVIHSPIYYYISFIYLIFKSSKNKEERT